MAARGFKRCPYDSFKTTRVGLSKPAVQWRKRMNCKGKVKSGGIGTVYRSVPIGTEMKKGAVFEGLDASLVLPSRSYREDELSASKRLAPASKSNPPPHRA